MTPQRGEIYMVGLDPVHGREQSGLRPVLVVSIDKINRIPLVITVVPGTDGTNVRKDYRHSVLRVSSADSGLPRETVFLCFQIRALDHARFPPHAVGRLTNTSLLSVEDALRYCFGL